MELKNGYKVIYDKAADGEHVFYASKTGVFADAEEIVRIAAGTYKLVYEKDGQFYGSATGKAADGVAIAEFNKVFVEAEAGNEPDAVNEEPVVEPAVEEPEASNEAPVEVEEPVSDEGESVTEEE